MPTLPEFSFKLNGKAALQNLAILSKYKFDLHKALDANKNLPLGPGSQFRALDKLSKVFSLHPLWQRMKHILMDGSKWPLVDISKDTRKQDVLDTLTFGNHKGALTKPDLLQKLVNEDIKYRYSFAIPLSGVTLVSGVCMALMKMSQNIINKKGQVVPNNRLTHDQSWRWSSSTSVNSWVQKDLLLTCHYGYCICCLDNWAVAARRKHPNQWILAQKIDYKSAYQNESLPTSTALQTVTQILGDNIALITLHLTFGGAPGPFEWGVVSETVCDLANKLLKCNNWDPLTSHVSVQQEIPAHQYLDNNALFTEGRELIIDVTINHQEYADIYIDDMMGLTTDLSGTQNADILEAAIPLAIEVAARPPNKNEPIPREPMIARDKLKAEGGLTETKTILGWRFNFQTLTMTLPEHKYIA
jgi:hypothetical protein